MNFCKLSNQTLYTHFKDTNTRYAILMIQKRDKEYNLVCGIYYQTIDKFLIHQISNEINNTSKWINPKRNSSFQYYINKFYFNTQISELIQSFDITPNCISIDDEDHEILLEFEYIFTNIKEAQYILQNILDFFTNQNFKLVKQYYE